MCSKNQLCNSRSLSSLRRTGIVPRSSSPSWNETFVFPGVSLKGKRHPRMALELSAWSFSGPDVEGEFLGEARVELDKAWSVADERARWIQLCT